MIPEITIKISFGPGANGGHVEPTVAALDIAPPELPAETVAPIPPPPDTESLQESFGADIPPPPSATTTAEEQIPPLPSARDSGKAPEDMAP